MSSATSAVKIFAMLFSRAMGPYDFGMSYDWRPGLRMTAVSDDGKSLFFAFETSKFLGNVGIDKVCDLVAVHHLQYDVNLLIWIGEQKIRGSGSISSSS